MDFFSPIVDSHDALSEAEMSDPAASELEPSHPPTPSLDNPRIVITRTCIFVQNAWKSLIIFLQVCVLKIYSLPSSGSQLAFMS
jgi:hypothetical protein